MGTYQGNPPMFKTPFTDFTAMLALVDIQMHGSPTCRKFEWRYFRCIEAYGLEKGFEKCGDIYEDLVECKYTKKQRARLARIRKEVEQQVSEGKRTFADPPDADALYQVSM